MMRIHTTQNLSPVANIQPNNLQCGTRFNLKGYPKDSVSSQPDTYEFCVAFKGKKGNLAKRIIESTKEDIKITDIEEDSIIFEMRTVLDQYNKEDFNILPV